MATAEYHREWRRRNPGRQEAAHRRYVETHGGAEAVNLARNHKIPVAEARELLAARPQNCDICGRDHLRLYYDHCHATGAHRGWLCNRCNIALNLIEVPDLLASALSYLEGG